MEAEFLRRGDGRLERVCEHGIGHTVAIDQVPYLHCGGCNRLLKDHRIENHVFWAGEREAEAWFTHGCDGCCKLYERLGV